MNRTNRQKRVSQFGGILMGLLLAITASSALACRDEEPPPPDPEDNAALRSDQPIQVASKWDCVEDGAESVGSAIERQWERVEDGLFGETEQERREEAQERYEDEQEELAERRRGEHCQ